MIWALIRCLLAVQAEARCLIASTSWHIPESCVPP